MTNKYLQKIANEFDFDAHNAMANTVKNSHVPPGGWQGNMKGFASTSVRRASGAGAVGGVKAGGGILKKIVGKLL